MPRPPPPVLAPPAPQLIQRATAGPATVARENRAYAKLQGMNGLCYYMTGFSATFGRGPGVDLVVSNDLAISRLHARVEYSSEAQAFELTVLGKNGAFVNGAFLRKSDHPHPLSSQTEITFGKAKPVTLIFLLPCAQGSRDISNKPQERRPRSLLFTIGATILGSPAQRLSADEILRHLLRQYGSYAASFGSTSILESSIRHALTANQHLFRVHPAADLEANVHAPDVEMFELADTDVPMPPSFRNTPEPVAAAKFSVVEKHAVRFLGAEHGHSLKGPILAGAGLAAD
jgi:predicted component of type VI protein secretion system